MVSTNKAGLVIVVIVKNKEYESRATQKQKPNHYGYHSKTALSRIVLSMEATSSSFVAQSQ